MPGFTNCRHAASAFASPVNDMRPAFTIAATTSGRRASPFHTSGDSTRTTRALVVSADTRRDASVAATAEPITP